MQIHLTTLTDGASPPTAAVSFAVIFTTGYSTTACRSTTLQQHLTGLLPPGVAVVGCSGYGLVGSGSDGQPVELDPQEKGRGVSVLLGHLPGVAAHAIAAHKVAPQLTARSGNAAPCWTRMWPC